MGLSYHHPSLYYSSVTGVVLYSIVLANALIICNLALVLPGMQKRGGYKELDRACFMISGRTTTALLLALLISIALAAVEALVQYWIVRAYNHAKNSSSSIVLEAMLLAYLYSILIVIDTIAV